MKHDALSNGFLESGRFLSTVLTLVLTFTHANGSARAAEPGVPELTLKAKQIYKNLNVTSVTDDAYIVQAMVRLLQQGKAQEAAAIAAESRAFYNVNVKQFASIMGSHSELPNVGLNDFQATVIGAVRDELDARSLLTGNYVYAPEASDKTYDNLESTGEGLQDALKKVASTIPDSAGLLTTNTWAQEHYLAGTNRRALEYTFREFLCSPIQRWRDVAAVDFRVRRDIGRNEGGDPNKYQTDCRGCHAPMDAMGGAFAKFDFVGNRLVYRDTVATKFNQHSNVYPEGYVTEDDSWINLATENQNQVFGWRGALSGHGVHQFGEMISNAQMFKSCMVRRVFTQLCRRAMSPAENTLELKLADQFEKDGYNLKKLFLNVSTAESCGGMSPQAMNTPQILINPSSMEEDSHEICTRPASMHPSFFR